jgi:hypothetical protein
MVLKIYIIINNHIKNIHSKKIILKSNLEESKQG